MKPTPPRITEAALRAKVTVLPKGMALDADLVRQMQGISDPRPSGSPMYSSLSECGRAEYNCAVWFTDMNNDGQLDAVLMTERIIETSNAKPPSAAWDAAVHIATSTEAKLLTKNMSNSQAPYWEPVGNFELKSYDAPGDRIDGATLKEWLAAIETKQIKPVAPQWSDLDMNGTRWVIQARP